MAALHFHGYFSNLRSSSTLSRPWVWVPRLESGLIYGSQIHHDMCPSRHENRTEGGSCVGNVCRTWNGNLQWNTPRGLPNEHTKVPSHSETHHKRHTCCRTELWWPASHWDEFCLFRVLSSDQRPLNSDQPSLSAIAYSSHKRSDWQQTSLPEPDCHSNMRETRIHTKPKSNKPVY